MRYGLLGDPFHRSASNDVVTLHHPLRLLPAGATVCRAGFAPAEGWCLSTAHSKREGSPFIRLLAGSRGHSRASALSYSYPPDRMTANGFSKSGSPSRWCACRLAAGQDPARMKSSTPSVKAALSGNRLCGLRRTVSRPLSGRSVQRCMADGGVRSSKATESCGLE